MYENSLTHYGIKGQKKGVRRYQNMDGSLTSAGKIRYGHPRAGQIVEYGRAARSIATPKNYAHYMRVSKGLTSAEKSAGLAENIGLDLKDYRKQAGIIGAGAVAGGVAAGLAGGIAPGIGVAAATVGASALNRNGRRAISNYVMRRRQYKMYRGFAGDVRNEPIEKNPDYEKVLTLFRNYPYYSKANQKQIYKEFKAIRRRPTKPIAHYGIKGQKKGVRRYQNEDGSLTSAGKQRYGVLGVLTKGGGSSGGEAPKNAIGVLTRNGGEATKQAIASLNSSGRMDSTGRVVSRKQRRLGMMYAKGARERSQALKRYDKTGDAAGKENAEARMSIAGRDLTGAEKAAGISRLQNRTAIGKAAKSALYAAAGVGASVALGNPAPLALGAASIKNLWQSSRSRKKSKIAGEYAKEHYNDDSDYLPENIRDVENMSYRYHPNRKHAKHDDLAHFGVKNMKWGVRNYQNKDGTLTEAGKIRYRSPKADQMKRYGAIARKREIYKEARRSGWSKNQARVNSKIPMYEEQAHQMGKGLTSAEKAAGIARSARRRTILPTIGSYIGLAGLSNAAIAGGVLGGMFGAPAAALALPSVGIYSALGGASINSFVKNHRLSKMYRRYAQANIDTKQTKLPSDLRNYSNASDAEQRAIRRKYYSMGHDDLSHHGIKGQKKGHRRYQNMDGSLTPEGKIRYGSPKAQRIKDYGTMKTAADVYASQRRGAWRNDATTIANAGAYAHNAKILGKGLTAAEKAAGYAHANRQVKATTAAGVGMTIAGAVMAGGTAGGMAAIAGMPAVAAAAAIGAPAAFLGAGGYMMKEYVRSRRAGKLYDSYAREHAYSKNKDLPEALENYSRYSTKVQKKIYKDYKKDHKNINKRYGKVGSSASRMRSSVTPYDSRPLTQQMHHENAIMRQMQFNDHMRAHYNATQSQNHLFGI